MVCIFFISASVSSFRSPSPPKWCDPYRNARGRVRLKPNFAIAEGMIIDFILSYWLKVKYVNVNGYVSFGIKYELK